MSTEIHELPEVGEIVIATAYSSAILHSPDLESARQVNAVNGCLKLDLAKIKRYAVIEIFQS